MLFRKTQTIFCDIIIIWSYRLPAHDFQMTQMIFYGCKQAMLMKCKIIFFCNFPKNFVEVIVMNMADAWENMMDNMCVKAA